MGREGIPAGRSPETVLEYLDGLDGTINAVESVAGDPIIGVAPIPIYNEGIRLQPITALGVARGFVDMFRVGKGIGAAIFCDDIDGWDRAVFILEDVTRGANLFATLAGPVAGRGGDSPQYTRSNLQLGQAKHAEYYIGKAGKEFRLPSGKRIDFLDIPNKTIYELKPNNPRAIKQGWKQLEIYRLEMESPATLQKYPRLQGIKWKKVLDTY